MSLKIAQQITLWRTLGHLTTANISLFESLEIVKSVVESSAGIRLINRLQDGIVTGKPLSDSLESETQHVSAFQSQMIRLAEKTGDYGTIFTMIADHLAWRQSWQGLVVQAIRYPLILLVLMGVLLAVLILLVLPGVQNQLALLGVTDIPVATQVLIFVGQYPGSLMLSGMTVITFFYMTSLVRRSQGKKPWRYDMPLIGAILYQLEITQFLHALGVMLSAKLDILSSLYQAAQTPTCPWLRRQLLAREHDLIQGQSLSVALADLLPRQSSAAALITIGEATGDLGRLLTVTCESDLEALRLKIKTALDLLQPALVMMMGGMMVWVVLAVLLPLYEAMGQWHG